MISNPFSQIELSPYQERTLDILEKSEGILLRYGYTKSTIDDIAASAKLGKGTLYLHWKSKDELFKTLFYKLSAEILHQMLLEVQKDQETIRFDKIVSMIYRLCHERALIVALFTKDSKLLGRFLDQKNPSQTQQAKFDSLINSLHMYRQHHLVKDDMPIESQAHTINMLLIGMFTYDNYLTETRHIDIKVELLENIIRNTFVPHAHIPIDASLYNYVINAIQDLLHFYMDQILNKTVK